MPSDTSRILMATNALARVRIMIALMNDHPLVYIINGATEGFSHRVLINITPALFVSRTT